MVLGKHRLSSYPSSQRAHSELLPAGMPRGRCLVLAGTSAHLALQSEIHEPASRGGTGGNAGRLQPPQATPDSPAAAEPHMSIARLCGAAHIQGPRVGAA